MVFVCRWAQHRGQFPLPTKEPLWKLPFPVTSGAIGQNSHSVVSGEGHGNVILDNHRDKIKAE